MNKWTGIGRLTRDPELIYTPSGVAVDTFTIAVDRRFKNAQGERETDFITIKTFKQLAELCSQFLSKGKLAGVSGELQIRTYNDKDGQKHWVTEIIADEVQFLSPKSEDQTQQPAQNNAPNHNQNAPNNNPNQPQYNAPSNGAPMGAPSQYRQSPGQPQQQPGQQQQGAPSYPGQFAPPGYTTGQQQGQWQAPGPGQQSPHPNMPNPNMPGQQQQGAPRDLGSFGHEVNLDDDIPF